MFRHTDNALMSFCVLIGVLTMDHAVESKPGITFQEIDAIATNDIDQDVHLLESCVPDGRPIPSERTFNSSSVEKLILQVGQRIKDPTIRQIFSNCLPNTLDTAVLFHKRFKDPATGIFQPYTYLVTGDISAMWLRDSAYQLLPYASLAKTDAALRDLFLGVINTQSEMIESYPYANAYFPLKHWNSGIALNQSSYAQNDTVDPNYPKDIVYEAKYELDSLAAFVYLCVTYTNNTGDAGYLENPHWVTAVTKILQVLRAQQGGTVEVMGHPPFNFTRPTRTQSETTNLYGVGNPAKRCGLIRSFFRPSDDATIFQFLIPSNALMAVAMENMADILNQQVLLPFLANELRKLASEIRAAIVDWAIVEHPKFGKVYAYEIDGFGSHVFMDDANFPSLLSLPNFGFVEKNDKVYQNTRRYVLSYDWNPYYVAGKYPGVGSPHTGLNKVWPVGLAMQAMTSTNETEIVELLKILRDTTAGTGFMHESFDVNEPRNFTRPWFTWANSVFGNLILDVDREYPHILSGH